jgi:hypothetical protein
MTIELYFHASCTVGRLVLGKNCLLGYWFHTTSHYMGENMGLKGSPWITVFGWFHLICLGCCLSVCCWLYVLDYVFLSLATMRYGFYFPWYHDCPTSQRPYTVLMPSKRLVTACRVDFMVWNQIFSPGSVFSVIACRLLDISPVGTDWRACQSYPFISIPIIHVSLSFTHSCDHRMSQLLRYGF